MGNEIVHCPQQRGDQVLKVVRGHLLDGLADLGPGAFFSLLKDDGRLHFVRFGFLDIGRLRLGALPGSIQAPGLVDE